MEVTINQITPRKIDGEISSVKVHFTARTSEGSINLNGNISLDEFANIIDFNQLDDVVKQEVTEQIMNGDNAE